MLKKTHILIFISFIYTLIIIPYIFYLYALLLNSINVNDVRTTRIENWGDTGLIPFNNEVLKKKSKAVHGLVGYCLVVNEMINTRQNQVD